jgi:hypothetical protein
MRPSATRSMHRCEIANHRTGGYGPPTPMLIEGPCGWCGHQEFLAHQPRSQVEAALACPTCRDIVASKLGDKTVEILVLSSSPEDVAHVPAVLMEGLVEITGTEFWKGVSARMPRARCALGRSYCRHRSSLMFHAPSSRLVNHCGPGRVEDVRRGVGRSRAAVNQVQRIGAETVRKGLR